MSTQQDLQDAVNKTIQEVNEGVLYKLQKESYLSLAKCMDLKNSSAVDECSDKATMKVQLAQSIISDEFRSFQTKLDKCSLSCQDMIRDKYPQMDNNLNNAQVVQIEYNLCQNDCIDQHMSLMNGLSSKIIHDIKRSTT